MFLSASFCFMTGSLSGVSAQLWRYARRVLRQTEMLKHKKTIVEAIKMSTSNLRSTLENTSQSKLNVVNNSQVRDKVMKRSKSEVGFMNGDLPRQLSLTKLNLKVTKTKIKPTVIFVAPADQRHEQVRERAGTCDTLCLENSDSRCSSAESRSK